MFNYVLYITRCVHIKFFFFLLFFAVIIVMRYLLTLNHYNFIITTGILVNMCTVFIFYYLLWCRGKARRWIQPLNTQFLQNSCLNTKLTMPFLLLARCNVKLKEKKKCIMFSSFAFLFAFTFIADTTSLSVRHT